jgi:fermentation-respiration switch protein FrsA (DUF1100 family)
MDLVRFGSFGGSEAAFVIRLSSPHISPVDAIHYVGHLSPTSLLFQSARLDPGVSEQDSLEFYNAASEPKQLKWYDATHEVTDIEAISDRARFLAEELKLSSIDPILRKKTGLK